MAAQAASQLDTEELTPSPACGPAPKQHPRREVQLRLRGRLRQSMAEHEAIVAALEAGDALAASDAIRRHVAVQGEKFHHLMSTLKSAAE